MNLAAVIDHAPVVKSWVIYSIEHHAYWNANCRGYTPNFDCAGEFTYQEAISIVREANRFTTEEMLIPVFEGEK